MARRTPRGAPAEPGLEEVVVIALAAARVARAISVDDITRAWRERLDRSVGHADGDRRNHRARRLLADLVSCPVCTGWWASLFMSTLWPGSHRIRRGLSVAGAQVLITLAERLVSEQGRAVIRQADGDEPSPVSP